MYKNKVEDGDSDACGRKLKTVRESLPKRTSQKQLADMLQRAGLDVDRNAIQRIKSRKRSMTGIELKMIADILKINYQDLLD